MEPIYSYEDYAKAYYQSNLQLCKIIGSYLLQRLIVNYASGAADHQNAKKMLQKLNALTNESENKWEIIEAVKFMLYSQSIIY